MSYKVHLLIIVINAVCISDLVRIHVTGITNKTRRINQFSLGSLTDVSVSMGADRTSTHGTLTLMRQEVRDAMVYWSERSFWVNLFQ